MNTILETFAETERVNRKLCEETEKENIGKVRAEEKKAADLQAQVERENRILAELLADYRLIEIEFEKAAAVEIEAKSGTFEKAKRGEISAAEFLKSGMTTAAVKKQAFDETKLKLADVAKLIREKKTEVFGLENELAEANYRLAYLTAASPRLRLEKLKLELESFTRSMNPINEACMAAQKAAQEAKEDFQLCGGAPAKNLIWDSLSYSQIQALRFDPRVPEFLVHEVEEFLFTADVDGKFSGKLVFTGERPPWYIQFRDLGGPRVVGSRDRFPNITTSDLP